jgi:hypothetical protein
MNRLDEIEVALHRMGSHWRPGHRSDIDTVLTLVAVARDAQELLDNYENFRDLTLNIGDLRRALAPLLESTGPRQGEGRHE